MADVKAFVGHSFTDDDKEVVAKFCEFFDSLAKLNPAFSWVHARAAEPKQLSEKVLTLIQDRTLFIGICTKKELVFASGRVHRFFNKLILRGDEVQSKTSDWIIQEIGLAVGRDLQLVLLIEEGLRRPGGLQGDVEYIPFQRNAPEKSYTRIAEMITALGLNTVSPQTAGTIAATTSSPDPVQPEAENKSSITPSADWTEDDYDFAQFRCIISENNAAATIVKDAYLKIGGDVAIRESTWDARNESIRMLFGKGGDLGRLRKLSEDNPSNAKIKASLARSIEVFGKHKEAAALYEEASLTSDDQFEKFNLLCDAAVAYEKAGSANTASAILRRLRADAGGGEKKTKRLLDALQELAEYQKDRDASLAVLERKLDLSPTEFRTRFELAYLHAELGNEDMALYHYLQISADERGATAWNNLGVAYDSFKIKGRAVSAYRRSEAMGETLAMANLGTRLLRAGFIDEAKAICDKALAVEGFHKNIGQLSISLREISDTETKATDDVLDGAKPRVEFYRRFGESIGSTELSGIAGIWNGPDCPMTLEITNDQIRFHGNFERDANPLSALVGILNAKSTARHRIEYTGVLRGRIVIGKVYRSSDDQAATSLLSSSTDGQKALMVMSENEIFALESSFAGSRPIVFVRAKSQ
jgi:tetratricopeptide (TPR) repeat protein